MIRMKNAVNLLLITLSCKQSESFSKMKMQSTVRMAYGSRESRTMKTPDQTRPLHMSSIPEDDDISVSSIPQIMKSIRESLPPLPEDRTALAGDILALFVYSYLDHTVHDMCAEASRVDMGEYITSLDSVNAPSLPVWFDVTHVNEFGHWLDGSSSVAYAPAIASGGLAFVAMATCWIISGYFSGAFLMKNTLECDAKNAMLVTGKTWILMAVLMVCISLGSDFLWAQLDAIHPLSDPARGGLTKADADFIFDSLSVLAFWRWMFNSVMGYR